jgi:hypothetical protein
MSLVELRQPLRYVAGIQARTVGGRVREQTGDGQQASRLGDLDPDARELVHHHLLEILDLSGPDHHGVRIEHLQ